MAISKIKSNSIADDAITSDKVADGVISAADVADGTLTNAKLADGTIENAKLADGTIENAKLAGSIANDKLANSSVTINGNSVSLGASASTEMFRNIIINGDMSIAQRGTSESGIGATGGTYLLDRFEFVNVGALGTWTMSQDTDVPSAQGFDKSLKLDCTTADAAPAASDILLLRQLIEGQNLQYLKKGTANASSLTASFWVKSSKTGTYILELFDGDNSRTISKSYTINSASTWEKKTITFAGDTTGAFDNDNAASLYLSFWLGSGTDYSSGTLQTSWGAYSATDRAVGQVNLADNTANEFYITGVQLEAGTTASDFEFLPHDMNLQRCLRYYEARTTALSGQRCLWTGDVTSGNTYFHQTAFNVTKRVEPTASITGHSEVSFNLATLSLQNTYSGKNLIAISCTSNGTSARGYFDYEILMDAEL